MIRLLNRLNNIAWLKGRWGFVLVPLAVLLLAAQTHYKFDIKNKGLRIFDGIGEKIMIIDPADWRGVNDELVEIMWTNVDHVSPTLPLPEMRFPIYLKKEAIVDQFGEHPEMDLFIGNVSYTGKELEPFRGLADPAEAKKSFRALYLDWAKIYNRFIDELARDPIAKENWPPGRAWQVSLNWVLYNLAPRRYAFRHVQGFRGDPKTDPHLIKADEALAATPEYGGLIGLDKPGRTAELVYRFAFDKPVGRAIVRDIHTAWQDGDFISLEISTDGQTWTRLYRDASLFTSRLFALRVDDLVAGAREIFLRYRFTLGAGSARKPGDVRGVNLYFLDLGVDQAG